MRVQYPVDQGRAAVGRAAGAHSHSYGGRDPDLPHSCSIDTQARIDVGDARFGRGGSCEILHGTVQYMHARGLGSGMW